MAESTPEYQMTPIRSWLPEGKQAAVVFTVDDIHPGTSSDSFEAGGDLGAGALGHLEALLGRQSQLKQTLFVTPDWREISAFPTRNLLARIPKLRDRFFLAPILPAGTMRLNRHPEFVEYLKNLPRTELALHGLEHIHRGLNIPMEYQDESKEECTESLTRSMQIFREAGLEFGLGLQPPCWHLPTALAEACVEVGLKWVCSSRDIISDVSDNATAQMSGLHGVSLIHPTWIAENRLIHITSNFQATSRYERALSIIDAGGVLAIKAHIIKGSGSYIALDGIDPAYCNYLDVLFNELKRRYGDSLFWCTPDELYNQIRNSQVERTPLRQNSRPMPSDRILESSMSAQGD